MFKRIYANLIIISLVISQLSIAVTSADSKPRKVIVVFNDKVVNERAQERLVQSVGGFVTKKLPVIDGLAVSLPNKASEKALEDKVGVSRVDEDVVVKASAKPPWAGGGGSSEQPPQTLEWGVDRIDADLAWNNTKGTASKIAIIDTGIDKDHPDLIANIKGGVNFVKKGRTVDPAKWDDDNGHGTHVAGIAAAVDNTIGVIGAAPEAHLYGVKVLDRNGSGYLSDVIAGVNWAVDNNMDAINMSLGTNSDIQSFRDAVDAAYAAGVIIVAAAGNDGDTDPDSDVDYPAAYDSVIAVAATDSNDNRASWSSDGPEVELSAPGVSIRSTWKDDGYNTISGTSMASPHVAGTAALILATTVNPSYDANANGAWDAAEVRQVLIDTADDLGATGFDNYFGYGLVDAEESATGTQT